MNVDEETLKRNRRFAVVLASSSGAILIAVVYIFVNRFPDYVDWGIWGTTFVLLFGILITARIRKRNIKFKRGLSSDPAFK